MRRRSKDKQPSLRLSTSVAWSLGDVHVGRHHRRGHAAQAAAAGGAGADLQLWFMTVNSILVPFFIVADLSSAPLASAQY